MVNSSNLGSGNLTNPFPCSCPHQIPSQSHAFNNQNPAPVMNTFHNQNTHLSNLHGNGISLPNQLPAMPFPCFPNGAAGNLALQNGYLGMNMIPQNFNQMLPMPVQGQFSNVPQNIRSIVPQQPHGQFLFHNGVQNPNQIMQSPQDGFNQQNSSQNVSMQPNGQFYSQPQILNQITGLLNGQFCSQNPIQNLNQVMPMQCSHLPMIQTHPTPFNIHLSSNPLVACPNQTLQAPGSLNSFFPVNPQLGVGNSNANPNSMVLSNEGTQFNNQGLHTFIQHIVNQNAVLIFCYRLTAQTDEKSVTITCSCSRANASASEEPAVQWVSAVTGSPLSTF